DGDHGGADGQVVGVAGGRHLEAEPGDVIDLDQSDIVDGVVAEHGGRELWSCAVDLDGDGLGAVDDVVVGQDVARGVDDEPRPLGEAGAARQRVHNVHHRGVDRSRDGGGGGAPAAGGRAARGRAVA